MPAGVCVRACVHVHSHSHGEGSTPRGQGLSTTLGATRACPQRTQILKYTKGCRQAPDWHGCVRAALRIAIGKCITHHMQQALHAVSGRA